MLENAKLKIIEAAIKAKQVNHYSVMSTFDTGAYTDICRFVDKHHKLPTADELMKPYRDNVKWKSLMAQIGIDVEEMMPFFEKALRHKKMEDFKGKTIASFVIKKPKPFAGTGRNEICPCGSGIKYKKCCGK